MSWPRIRQWIINHDDSTLFNILYIGFALVLSITLGLFWLVAVVGVHALFEIYRQHQRSGDWGFALAEMIWELKLDFGLIIFAFALAIYLEYIFGVAGLAAGSRVAAQSAGRMTQASNRIILWQRLIRGFFLSLDDIGLALRAFGSRMRGKKQAPAQAAESGVVAQQEEVQAAPQPTTDPAAEADEPPTHTSWRGAYSRADYAILGFGGICLVLIAVAPPIIGSTYADVWGVIVAEMRPFPE
ncbi:hypothetical protein [Candidatus Viridilinea mediisalina]|uniref:Uncharacterized protein n=1 Tax=Candidatus Viridilinea mediisalina TaxID=2024553 RepID=A0A2A6RLQ2_9CHLR|nr:hypothetical protein [Candidatus Viridilinea mediisalina]PDW03770.1 hypothetical protein CJ255_06845 [Candidatus Viridilinea mediisalina]